MELRGKVESRLQNYRELFGEFVSAKTSGLCSALGIASAEEIRTLEKRMGSLSRKVSKVGKQVKDLSN